MMHTLRKALTQHPLIAFFILAYALSWISVPFANGQQIPQGPFIAALIVLPLHEEERTERTGLWREITRWRVGWRWYLIAPCIVMAYILAALALNLLLGATVTNSSRLLSFGIMAPLIMELVIFGGMWEEPGWSGYALPRLQARFGHRPGGLLIASLVMGVLRAGWHLPLWIYGHIPWSDVLFSIPLQFLITWLFNRTGGSVLMVMLLHLTSNVLGGGITVPLFAGVDRMRYAFLFAGFACLEAFFLTRRNGWSMGTRSRQ